MTSDEAGAYRLTFGGECPVCAERYGWEELVAPYEPADFPGGTYYVHAVRINESGERTNYSCGELEDGDTEEWNEDAWRQHNEYANDGNNHDL